MLFEIFLDLVSFCFIIEIDNHYQLGGFELENKETFESFSKARRLTTEMLFEGRTEVLIIHRDEEYRLRITKNDKLILTK